MQPFMRMCHWRAKPSASCDPGLLAKPPMKPRISESWRTLSRRTGLPGSSMLEHHVDERAALEVVAREPLAEDVEDRQQPLRAASRARARTVVLQPVARPALLAPLEEGQDEVVLGREVAIERHLRHARLGDDPVDADRPRAVRLNSSYAVSSTRSRPPAGGTLLVALIVRRW